MNLTPQEEKLLNCMSAVNPESIWGLAIHKVLNDYTVERFRALIQQLRSQNQDNPEVMKEILSCPCYETFVNA